MYWNVGIQTVGKLVISINRNMRCIEISYVIGFWNKTDGLIETWDVLKWFCV